MTQKLMRLEIEKCLNSKTFVVSITVGFVLVILSLGTILEIYYSKEGLYSYINRIVEQGGESKENLLMIQFLYNSWIGGDRESVWAALFYVLSPVLAALPCGYSFSAEIKSGYLRNVIPKTGRNAYFFARINALFICGGLSIVLPQLISFVLSAIFFPAVKPNVLYSMYLPIDHGVMFSSIFYTYPLVFIGILMIENFVFGGLFAWLSTIVSWYSKSWIASIIIPFIMLLLADMSKVFLYYVSYTEVSPLSILHPLSPFNVVKLWVVVAWAVVLIIVSVSFFTLKGWKYEIV